MYTRILVTLGCVASIQALGGVAFGWLPPTWFYVLLAIPLLQTALLSVIWLGLYPNADRWLTAAVDFGSMITIGVAIGIYTSDTRGMGMRMFPETYTLMASSFITGFPAFVIRPVVQAIEQPKTLSSAGIALTCVAIVVHYSMGILSFTHLDPPEELNVGDIDLVVMIAQVSGLAVAGCAAIAMLVVTLTKLRLLYASTMGLYRWFVVVQLLLLGYVLTTEGLAWGKRSAEISPVLVALVPVSASMLYMPSLYASDSNLV